MMPPESLSPGAGSSRRPVLIFGCGNPGRQDDGLGVALVQQLEAWAPTAGLSGFVFDTNYQLNAEDALAVAGSREVVFVDAAETGPEPFAFRPLPPRAQIAFSTHAMSPESVLALAVELYDAQPPAWLLAIRGHAWEPNAAPTAAGQANLAAALHVLQDWCQHRH